MSQWKSHFLPGAQLLKTPTLLFFGLFPFVSLAPQSCSLPRQKPSPPRVLPEWDIEGVEANEELTVYHKATDQVRVPGCSHCFLTIMGQTLAVEEVKAIKFPTMEIYPAT